MKILIVDDEYEVVASLREYLTLRGYTVSEAAEGEEALALVQQAPPDLILLDIRLPGMSGFEVLKRVRAQHPQIKVIMITALDEVGVRRIAMEHGAAGFAFKPLDVQALERVIVATSGQRPPLAPRAPFKASQVTVLVVDDDPEICVALKYYLVGLGYQVLIAASGAEAITLLQETKPRPDVMLLDLSMPGEGGFTVLESLKRQGIQLPIVILSGNDPEIVGEATALLGACRFLQKPVPLPTIERTIREVVAGGAPVPGQP